MKPILLSFLATIVLAQPRITLTGPPVRPGSTAVITATITGAAGVASISWVIPATPGASTNSGKMVPVPGAATIAAGKTLSCAFRPTLSDFICTVFGGNVLADGVLATVSFPAPSTSLTLPLSGMIGVNAAADSPGIAVTSGPVFTLAPLSPCDINTDGTIDLLDVRNVVDQIERVVPAVTDLNGDGRTDVIDLQRVINAVVDGVCRLGA
jgi:hypothetical protein